jgi:tetratricopeptide (TPR) repeat protein
MILFADRERHPRFDAFDPYLKFAPRYEAGTPAMEHNAFVSQGAVVKDDSVRRGYEAICTVILKFLDAYVLGDAGALRWLHAEGSGAPLHLRYRAGAPPPPTSAQIARLYLAEGPADTQAIATLMKAGDAETLIGAASVLFDAREKKQAVELLKSAARLHPRSAAIAQSLGEALQQTGEREAALASYQKALALLPGDDTLTAPEKAQLRKSVEDSLALFHAP